MDVCPQTMQQRKIPTQRVLHGPLLSLSRCSGDDCLVGDYSHSGQKFSSPLHMERVFCFREPRFFCFSVLFFFLSHTVNGAGGRQPAGRAPHGKRRASIWWAYAPASPLVGRSEDGVFVYPLAVSTQPRRASRFVETSCTWISL